MGIDVFNSQLKHPRHQFHDCKAAGGGGQVDALCTAKISNSALIKYDSKLNCRLFGRCSPTHRTSTHPNIATVTFPPPRNRTHVVDCARAVNACLTNTGLSQTRNCR
ncbi:hypothetical protein BOTBODRAFT_350124 [Botryobasidium botryosum FD-172 SS1]|uniref:Uncharacterized protein n=1 Tax=Botryobasidium botryosum (strain FD-172 SS1) TaxID=930990 RepID=A0A067MFV8_BOTB1|nr:hypothetical protein BOTBODRAFT_350124 [Botryobasidium botryosum FD-172 SS1]